MFFGTLPRLLTALGLAAITLPARAQGPAFTSAFACGLPAANSSCAVEAVVPDPTQGRVFVTGSFRGTVSFGSTVLTSGVVPGTGGSTGSASFDAFVACLDAATGNVLWANQVDGAGDSFGRSLSLRQGQLVLAGTARLPAQFGAATLPGSPTGPSQAMLARLDPATGAWLWHTLAGGTGQSGAWKVVADPAGLLVAGYATNGSGTAAFPPLQVPLNGAEAFVGRVDAGTGAWQWVKPSQGANGGVASGLALDGWGHAVVSGLYNGAMQLPGLNSLPAGVGNLFVARLDLASQAWQWAAAGTGAEQTTTVPVVAADSLGNVVVGGSFVGLRMQLGPYQLANTSRHSGNTLREDAFAAGLDGATGAWRWTWRSTGDAHEFCRDVALDGRGDAYLTGFAQGTCTLGGQALPAIGDLFVARLSAATGGQRWLSSGGARGYKFARTLLLDATAGVWVGGEFSGMPADVGGLTLSSSGTGGLVARLNSAAGPLAAVTARPAPGRLRAWPVPTARQVWLTGAPVGTRLTLIDALGRTVWTGQMPAIGPLALPALPALPAGAYQLRCADGATTRLLVQP